MSPRSTISIQHECGQVKSIYCHWDGYPSHNGAILDEHYSDPEKIEKLMDLGDLVALGAEIGDKHSGERVEGVCTAYDRDYGWGADNSETEVRCYDSEKDFFGNFARQEYDYYYKNGRWYVSMHESPFIPLSVVLHDSFDVE